MSTIGMPGLKAAPLDRTAWAALVSGAGPGTISPFQLPEWMDFELSSRSGAKDCSLAFRLADGAWAGVPIVGISNPIGRVSYWSTASDEYGGILAERPLTNAEFSAIYHHLGIHRRPMRLTVAPELSAADVAAPPAPWRADYQTSHLLALPATYEEWSSKIANATCRRNIRRAVASALSVSRDKSDANVDAYYRLYLSSSARWGTSERAVRPRQYFAGLAACPLSRLYIVYKDSVPAAGVITLESRDCTLYYLGATELSFSSLRAPDLALAEVIRDSIANARRMVNFGGSLGSDTLEQFKEKFGAVKCVYPTYYTPDVWSSVYRWSRYYRAALRQRVSLQVRRWRGTAKVERPDRASVE